MMREYHLEHKVKDITKHRNRTHKMRFELINSLMKSHHIDDDTIIKIEVYEDGVKYYEYEVSGVALQEDFSTDEKMLLLRVDV